MRALSSREVLRPAVGAHLLPGGARRGGLGDQLDWIACADLAALEDARVDAALTRMIGLAHPVGVAVAERARGLPARRGVRGDLDQDLAAEAHLRAGDDQRPVER